MRVANNLACRGRQESMKIPELHPYSHERKIRARREWDERDVRGIGKTIRKRKNLQVGNVPKHDHDRSL